MKLARVIGRLWATSKHESLEGRKILLVRPLTLRGDEDGEAYLAIDSVGAGAGERVLIVDEGGSAGKVLDQVDPPIRTVVVGIVDHISIAEPSA